MNLLERIEHLRLGRRHHGWLGAIGVSNDSIKKIKEKSGELSENVLNIIAKCENASYLWLVDGEGSPYRVARFESDIECKEALEEYLSDEAWTAYLVNDYQKQALVLTLPSSFERSHGGFIEYMTVEVFAGVGEESITEAALNASAFKVIKVSSEVMKSLIAGELGTYALLGDAKNEGILSKAELVVMNDRLSKYAYGEAGHNSIAEQSAGDSLSEEDRLLLNNFNKLSVDNKKAVMTLIKNLT